MKVKILFLVVLSMLFSQNFRCQNSAEEVLNNIQNKFSSIDDLSADLIQSVNGKTNIKGKVFYQKENKLRFEFKNILIITDGETSWNYNQKDDKVIITSYNINEANVLSLRQIIFDYPENCKLNTYESEGNEVLELVPKDDTFSFNSIKLFLNKDYLINKAIIDDPASGTIQIELSNYKLNTKLSEDIFQFSPPEGSQVIDLR